MKIFVRLKILFEKDDASQIEKLTHLEFDRVWMKGDKRPNTNIIEKYDGCILNSGISTDEPLEQHLSALLISLHDAVPIIKNISENNTVEVSCAIYDHNIPAFYFDRKVIEGIANIGASLDIDFYLLPPIEKEEELDKVRQP
jgi:hypothetical protein